MVSQVQNFSPDVFRRRHAITEDIYRLENILASTEYGSERERQESFAREVRLLPRVIDEGIGAGLRGYLRQIARARAINLRLIGNHGDLPADLQLAEVGEKIYRAIARRDPLGRILALAREGFLVVVLERKQDYEALTKYLPINYALDQARGFHQAETKISFRSHSGGEEDWEAPILFIKRSLLAEPDGLEAVLRHCRQHAIYRLQDRHREVDPALDMIKDELLASLREAMHGQLFVGETDLPAEHERLARQVERVSRDYLAQQELLLTERQRLLIAYHLIDCPLASWLDYLPALADYYRSDEGRVRIAPGTISW
jgi:hypothetical protein